MSTQIAKIGDNMPPENTPESLTAAIADRHALVLHGAAKLLDARDRLPLDVNDDETAGKVGDYIKLVTGCIKNLESIRVSEKEPYLTLGRCVDGFFKKTTDNLGAAKIAAGKPLEDYLKRQAAAEQRRRIEEGAALRKKMEDEAHAAQLLREANMKEDSEKMLDKAVITEQAATKVEQSAMAKPAEMAQSRSQSGALSSLRTVWVGHLESQKDLDLEKLRHHLDPAALQKAINSFVAAGGRELAGANIFEESKVVTR